MHLYFAPPPPDPQPTPHHAREAQLLHRSESLRKRAHRAQRAFLAVNAVPLAAGIVLHSFTDVPAIPVYGRLTLGLLWGILQSGLFVATAWWYEARCTRSCDPIEHSLVSDILRAEQSGARPVNGFGR